MKFALAFLTLFFFTNSFSQTGGIVVSFELAPSISASQDSISVQVWQDSTFLFKANTLEQVVARDLPLGNVDLYCSFRDSFFVFQHVIFIQANQLVYQSYTVDSSLLAIQPKGEGKFSYSNDATLGARNRNVKFDFNRVPTSMSADVLSIEEVQIVAYSNPLINKDGGASGTTITREDIATMPARSVNQIASTVAGVNVAEGSNGIHIRGARSNQNAYYIDGIRVRSLDRLPGTYFQEVQVITGGTPACYGDATGGIILIDGLTRNSVMRNRIQRGLIRTPDYSFQSNNAVSKRRSRVQIEPKISFDRFSPIYENDFLSPLTSPNSTFGLDVDQASWYYIKTKFNLGETIHRDAVKMEEMLNSFQHKDAKIEENELIGVELERNNCAWNSNSELVTIRVRAADLPENKPRKSHNIVLLVDVSGSMAGSNKLDLLVQGFKDFVSGLEQGDRISIVTYSGKTGVALKPTTCDQKRIIYSALSRLRAAGSTNGAGGIQMAYKLAEQYYDPQFNNRIIMATDGDFNVGISSTSELEEYISTKRGQGIYLTALGFGMGNYRNDILETLADRGDGNHFYINDLETASKVLSGNIGNLINIARDVKLNVEFNPAFVTSYRLIGYENRLMPSKDFTNDAKDGGEMGYGHSVIAMYEITRGKETKSESHFTKTKSTFNRQELAFVKLRYKPFEDSVSVERKFSLAENTEIIQNDLVNLVASFGLMLRNSVFKGEMTKEKLVQMAKNFNPQNDEEIELWKMILSLD